MPRTMTAATLAALQADDCRPVRLLVVDLEVATFYLCDAYKPITWQSNEYTALGHFLEFDGLEESSQLTVTDTTVSLSGVDQAWVASLLSQQYINRPGRIYVGALDSAWQLIVDPVLMIAGPIDDAVLVQDPEQGSSVISLKIRNHFADFERKSGRSANAGSQDVFFPGDKGFDFAGVVGKAIYWGKAK